MIYYLILFVLVIFSLIEAVNENKKVSGLWLFLVGVFLMLFAGFRTVGVDVDEYKNYYEISKDVTALFNLGVEPAYAYLNYLFKTANIPISILFLFIAAIAISVKMLYIRRYSPYIFISIIIYYTTLFIIKEMGQIRHGVAIAFVLIAFGLMAENRNKLALMFIAVAFTFHYSAFCVLPAFFIVKPRINSAWIIAILLLLFPIVLMDLKPLFVQVISLIPNTDIRTKGEFYINSPLFGNKIGINSSLILRVIVVSVMLFYRKVLEQKMSYFNAILNLYFMGLCYYITLSSVEEFAARASVYFRSLEIIILPSFVLLGKTLGERLLILLLLSINGLYSLYNLLHADFALEAFSNYDNQLLIWISNLVHNSSN